MVIYRLLVRVNIIYVHIVPYYVVYVPTWVRGLVFVVNIPAKPRFLASFKFSCSMYNISSTFCWVLIAPAVPIISPCMIWPVPFGRSCSLKLWHFHVISKSISETVVLFFPGSLVEWIHDLHSMIKNSDWASELWVRLSRCWVNSIRQKNRHSVAVVLLIFDHKFCVMCSLICVSHEIH